MNQKCNSCKKKNNLKKCAGCSVNKPTYYCSRECQKKDFKKHKKVCQSFIKKENNKSNEKVKFIGIVTISFFPKNLLLLNKLYQIENKYYKQGTINENLYSFIPYEVQGIGTLLIYTFEEKHKVEFEKLLEGTNMCLNHYNITYLDSKDIKKNKFNKKKFKIKKFIKNKLKINVEKIYWIREGKLCDQSEEVIFNMTDPEMLKAYNDFKNIYPKTTENFIKEYSMNNTRKKTKEVLNSKDENGKTPLDLALENGHNEIADMLLKMLD